MKLKLPVWGWMVGGIVVLGVTSAILLNQEDGLAWKRFKRHAGVAIRSRSFEEATSAVSKPATARVAATIPYNGFARLVAFSLDHPSSTGNIGIPLVFQPDGRKGWVYHQGDVEWLVSLTKGRYAFVLYEPGALTKRLEADWDPIMDLDLGRIELVYGDLDGDDFISSKEVDFMKANAGRKLPSLYMSWLDHGDIDRNGQIDGWEVSLVARNQGKRGDHRLTPMFASMRRLSPNF